MKFSAGLIILAAYMPYMVWADAAAAAAAASSSSNPHYGGSSSAAAVSAASSSSNPYYGRSSSAAAAAAASSTSNPYYGGSSSAAAAAAASGKGAAAATATAAASSASPGRTVRCPCTAEYNPVCGTDGYTYSNKCMLKCVSDDNACYGIPAIRVYHYGHCKTISCNCPKIDQTICGTNNQTYANECNLNCENAVRSSNGLKPISISYHTACQQPTCVCPDSIVPVCGTDGKTYRNVCIMECYSRIDRAKHRPAICVDQTGACKNETCTCMPKNNELCASDEKTYYNDCVLDCQNRRRNQLGQNLLAIQYRGKCIKCDCPKDYSPVCAKDNAFRDYSFSNYCQFRCYNRKLKAAKRPPLILRWGGRCDCDCSKKWSPVCATNNYTYQNICDFRCDNRKRLQDRRAKLFFKHNGVCRQCNCNYCGEKYEPLCGSDGRTYHNPCWLQCNNNCRPYGPKISKICDGEC